MAGGVNAQSEKWSSGQSKLANGDAEGAYRELLAFEGRFVGTPEYDYLLGLAALESGQRDITVLSTKARYTSKSHARIKHWLAKYAYHPAPQTQPVPV